MNTNENKNYDYLKYIDLIIKKSTKKCVMPHGDYVEEYYICKTDIGTLVIRLSFDMLNNRHVDLVEYFLQKAEQSIFLRLYTIANAKEFYENILRHCDFSYEVINFGGIKDVKKPKELKGVKQIGSAKLGTTSNGVFILNDDLYIKCNDYFSPMVMEEKDGKYETAYYRRRAWVKFNGFMNLLSYYNDVQIAKICCRKITEYHNFANEISLEWNCMFEEMCKLIRMVYNKRD